MSRHQDVIIVGGGMVGATLACALAREGLRVAVVEGERPMPPGSDVDLRVSAVNRASEYCLRRLGAWQIMDQRRLSPFRAMRVWDADSPGTIHFDSADVGEPLLGHIVENSVIQAALWMQLEDLATVTLYCPAAVTSERVGDEVEVTLDNGETLTAPLLVAADGARSQLRQRAAIPVTAWAYDQRAVVTHVATADGHQHTAWQRFLSTGPLAFLPLYDGRCSIVWSTTPEQAASLCAMPEDDFRQALETAFDGALGTIEAVGPRASFSLQLQHAHHYVAPRLALVGDAAHVIHPLAGQGVNLGIFDAAALAEVVATSRASGRDIGAYRTLRRYERWRKGDNLLMMAAMDGFKRLFGAQGMPVRWARGWGLRVTDQITPLKQVFMTHAMGARSDLPALCQPLLEGGPAEAEEGAGAR